VKGFESEVVGPKGEWYRKVRDRVSQVKHGWPEAKVVELLGEPDEIGDDSSNQSRHLQELMENVAGGPTLIAYGDKIPSDRILRYRDPFRPRKTYVFTIKNGAVRSIGEDTVSAQQDG